ncbi:peptide ligase PGM1-related protein [Paenibacillus sp. S-38]|uniref:peptide ligase PGM1-related protein n=1 Tax=Paenibacillus sp. S-38 TaxID=3416710 RepID=UPI003CECD291
MTLSEDSCRWIDTASAGCWSFVEAMTTGRRRDILVWLCNIGAEQVWHPATGGITDREEDRAVHRMEEMNLLLCRRQDVLLLREVPDKEFLRDLEALGFEIPRILCPAGAGADPYTPIAELVLKDAELLRQLEALAGPQVYFLPYAVTEREEEIAARTGLRLIGPSSRAAAAINDKAANRAMAQMLGLPVCRGTICRSAEELLEAYEQLYVPGASFIVKDPYSASGRGLHLVESPERMKGLVKRLMRFGRRSPETGWILEEWIEKSGDYNYQLFIREDGEIEVFSLKGQLLEGTVYRGSHLEADRGPDLPAPFREYGQRIGKALYTLGYQGMAGVDAIRAADGTLIPLIEVNGRFTLSTYLSFVTEVLAPAAAFVSRYFRLVTRTPLTYSSLKTRLEAEGLVYRADSGEGVLVYTSGTLPQAAEGGSGRCVGRVFVLIAAASRERLSGLESGLESLLNHIQQEGE